MKPLLRSVAPLILLLPTSSHPAAQEPVPLLSARGLTSEDGFALLARGLDDLDGDGFADFAVARSREGGYRGTVDLVSGRTGQRFDRLLGRAGQNDSYGTSIERLGDLDGDGVDEFAVGAIRYLHNGVSVGALTIYSGAARRVLHLATGLGEGDLFGAVAADAGDVDADGIPDVIVGAPENGSPVLHYGPGYADVLSGRDFSLLHRFEGVAIGDEFASSVAGVGDLDRDGHADVMIGSLLELGRGQGSARVYSGRTGRVVFDFYAETGADHFGLSIGAMGDVDGDGTTELYASQISMTNAAKGAVFVFSGRDGTSLQVLRGDATSGIFGRHVRAPGDVDGDGVPDLLVTDPADAGTGARLGAVHLFSGRTWSRLWTLRGPAPGTGFAGRLALLDDHDDDGRDELLTGYVAYPGDPSWRVDVLSFAHHVARVGRGCADPTLGGVAPELDSAVMSVGQLAPMTVRGARPMPQAGLLLGSEVAPVGLPFGPCAVYLDPISIGTVRSFSTDVAGRWFGTIPLPADPRLIGRRLAFQALLFTPSGFDLTQGLQVTVGR